MPSAPIRKLGKTALMAPAPIRKLGKTAIKRAAGLKPGVVPAALASGTAGTVAAVLTYRVLRSH